MVDFMESGGDLTRQRLKSGEPNERWERSVRKERLVRTECGFDRQTDRQIRRRTLHIHLPSYFPRTLCGQKKRRKRWSMCVCVYAFVCMWAWWRMEPSSIDALKPSYYICQERASEYHILLIQKLIPRWGRYSLISIFKYNYWDSEI